MTSTTAIMVTHDQEEALATADQLAIMQDGKLIAFGAPHALYNTPQSITVAQLLGEINVIPARVETDGSVRTEFGFADSADSDQLTPGEQGSLIVRPEALVIDNNSIPNANIIDSLFHGHDSLVSVRMTSGLVVKKSREPTNESRFPGTQCSVIMIKPGTFLRL